MSKNVVLISGALIIGAFIGYLLPLEKISGSATDTEEKKIAYWVAPMDPNYRRDEPGKSPMGMDLVPVYEGEEPGSGDDADIVKVSPTMINNLGVRIAPVEKTHFSESVNTVGYVGYNEDRTSHVHVREDGWIENLVVRSMGIEVKKGELLFELFSRNIAVAAQEYINELKRGSQGGMRGAKSKLKALGMAESQIERMARTKKPEERIKIFAPQNGVIVDFNIGDGMFVSPSMTALTISDLSSVWVIADVFESHGERIFIGMEAQAHLPQGTHEISQGQVDFIYPELDPVTRTLRVRLKFDNPDLALRPNMFVNINLKGRSSEKALSIPSEALIRDGTVDRVIRDLGEGRFKAVAVKTGRQNDDRVEILKGLEEGDKVVTSAQFLIDSESNLNGALARLVSPDEKEQQESTPIIAKGVIHERVAPNKVNVTHAPIPALGWPDMTMDFELLDGENSLDDDLIGKEITFEVAKGTDGMFGIRAIKTEKEEVPSLAWGTGVINKVGKNLVNITHEPIPALGWPDMTMDLPVKSDISLDGFSQNQKVRFGLGKGSDGMFQIHAIEQFPDKEGDNS